MIYYIILAEICIIALYFAGCFGITALMNRAARKNEELAVELNEATERLRNPPKRR